MEVNTDTKRTSYLQPSIRTLVDMDAAERSAIKHDRTDKAIDFAVNEGCAACVVGAALFGKSLAEKGSSYMIACKQGYKIQITF